MNEEEEHEAIFRPLIKTYARFTRSRRWMIEELRKRGCTISFTCPTCKMTTYNLNDLAEGYCGHCHEWIICRDRNNARDIHSEGTASDTQQD